MIILKSAAEINKIRESNQIVVEILEELLKQAQPGVTTEALDVFVERALLKKNAQAAFKGYNGYPSSLCASINEEIVHGIPSKRKLKEGDILSLDFGVLYNGYYGDAAITMAIGEISTKAQKLLQVTEEALYLGIEKARVGNHLFDISHAIQTHVENNNFSVVRDFVGHGIGTALHEEPQIPNYGNAGEGVELQAGMVLAIEPMVNAGGSETIIKDDGWTAITRDRSLSAHFEHSIALTKEGPLILTKFEGV